MNVSLDPLRVVGQTIADKYPIERLEGEGGFVVVCSATHTIWKRADHPAHSSSWDSSSSKPCSPRTTGTKPPHR